MTESGKKAPDWERIEADYRAGILSLREIAEPHGITEGAIRKKAKTKGWVRDLSAKVQAKADDLVRRDEVRSEVRSGSDAYERTVIESNALAIANVRLSHRGDIRRFRNLAVKLLDELEHQTDNQDLYKELGIFLRQESESGVDRLNDLYKRVIDTPSRIDSTKKLADTLKILVGLEREAYGLENSSEPTAPIPSGLGHMYGGS